MVDLQKLKEKVIVLDLETSSFYPGTNDAVNIRTNFEDYVKYAKVKWFGAYSYATGEIIADVVQGNEQNIKSFIAKHDIIVGFNVEEFDVPILYNNNLMPTDKRFLIVDNMVILGDRTFMKKDGQSFKGRGELMGLDFENNSLRAMASAMKLETQKGDIDYTVFYKDTWNQEEFEEISKYLESDVMATKQMFDKLWDFWFIFTEFLPAKHVENLSWIRNSIASLTYKCACHALGVEDTYSDKREKAKEEMGGRVIEPKYEEAKGVWYIDYASLYPHMFTMFNLFAENKTGFGWNGNEMFKTKGYYNVTEHHPLAKYVAEKLQLRIAIKHYLKQEDKTDIPEVLMPFFVGTTIELGIEYLKNLAYALKILLNSLYGAVRSPIFEQIHKPNAGWDCCWLGQQVQMHTEKRLTEMGFETIAGDTDSLFVIPKIPEGHKKEYVVECLTKIVDEIKANVPFPVDTYSIEIENYLDYIMWPFSEQPVKDDNGENKKIGNRLVKERRAKKKNYVYIYREKGKSKIKIMGLPIIKNNATSLGPLILEEVLKPLMLERTTAKFSKEFMEATLARYLAKPECLEMLAVEYKVKAATAYKLPGQIQRQISEGYFNGQEGVISLIKNKKVGSAGKGQKYATVDEVLKAGLTVDDLDLTKVKNELEAFVEY